MSDFDAIDSLLASVGPQAELPAHQVRRELREQAGLSKAQVARALGVSPSTVSGWESARDPVGEIRTKYAYLLDALSAKLPTETETETETETAAAPAAEQPGTAAAPGASSSSPETGQGIDEVEVLAAPQPCVLCGGPAGQRVAGFVQHLDVADCRPATGAGTPPAASSPGGVRSRSW
ncbi:helix-turn-helix domain-containing protein [Streptomyces hypolithicus]